MGPREVILIVAAGAIVVGVGVLLLKWIARRAKRATALVAVDAALASGEYRRAEDLALAALAEETDAAICLALRCRLARSLVGVEEYTGAVRVCEEAAEVAPSAAGQGEALVEMARCHAAAGEFEAAQATLARTTSVPLEPDARLRRYLVTADVALARLRFEEAERALANGFGAAAAGAFADEAAIGHARLQYLRGNFHQAIAELNRLLQRLHGEDLQALALITLARSLLDQERPAAVEAEQSVASALLLAHYPGLLAIGTACSALAHAHFGNEKEALEAAATAPGLTVSKRYGAEAHCLSGDALRRLHRYAEARAHYQTALGLDSECLEALWGLGTCAQMSGLYEVAESYFQLCLEAAPEHFLGRRSEDAIDS
jgi:tetratricopeptide (TPR) repeat protein